MIEYENKNVVNKFKIGNNAYKIDINQVYSENGPKVAIKVNVDSSAFHIDISNLDPAEVHTALNEIMNALVTVTHAYCGVTTPTAMAVPAKGGIYNR